jgi:hypothetical protein
LRRIIRAAVWTSILGNLAAAQTNIEIRLEGDPPLFRVRGSAILSRLRTPNFPYIFQVSVDKAGMPAIAGAYTVDQGGELTFQPAFALEPGVPYKATFRLSSETATATFLAPKPKVVSTTTVERVYPSANQLPENQLKFYIHFSAPMSRGEAVKRLHLLDGDGKSVPLPFLELDEELWDRDYRRLTVLFDPGRVKRDLLPNREVGAPLKAGNSYTLVVSKDWPDGKGIPLVSEFRKPFRVIEADRKPLDPKTWTLTAPPSGTQAELALDTRESLDAALLLRFIDVVDAAGKIVKGAVRIEREESRWVFTPAENWKPGRYNIEILATLEDLAGNKIGRAFDVDRFDRVDQAPSTEIHSLAFTVK